jgi:hypothetical protein
MRRFINLVSLLSLAWLAPAQHPVCAPPSYEQQRMELQRELIQWQLEHQTSSENELAKRRAREDERRDFEQKLNRFVGMWNKFVSEYNRQRTFDVKEARALAKAFREIEATGWPK